MSDHLRRLCERYPGLEQCERELSAALAMLINAFENDKKLLVCGNGGSAADSEHLVAELMKAFRKPRPLTDAERTQLSHSAGELGAKLGAKLQGALPAVSLASPLSLITAVANDVDAEMIFAQQVYGLGRPGDVLLAITTSGNSANVIHAVAAAKAFGIGTIALTGRTGGAIAPRADIAIKVPADTVAEIQELHLPVYHYLAIALEEHFFPG